MGATVYGRRAIRRFERETGERIVHAIGKRPDAILTTIDHRHLAWVGEAWTELVPFDGHCGLGGNDGMGGWWSYSSCSTLFGDGGHHRGFMRGPCNACGIGLDMLHRADCAKLADLLGWRSINPDYWPKPVHRPQWLDDPRCPQSPLVLTHRIAYAMDLPPQALLYQGSPNHWGSAWVLDDGTAMRQHFESMLKVIGSDTLRAAGLDPERYTLGMDWQPGPYAPGSQ